MAVHFEAREIAQNHYALGCPAHGSHVASVFQNSSGTWSTELILGSYFLSSGSQTVFPEQATLEAALSEIARWGNDDVVVIRSGA
jgi:hypothetical protein